MKHNPSVPIIIKNFIDDLILPQVNSMNWLLFYTTYGKYQDQQEKFLK